MLYQSHLFPRNFVTADLVVVNEKNQILLIQRLKPPFKDCWALPGGFFDPLDATVEDAALRELSEEVSIRVNATDLKLIGVFSKKGRDPRETEATEPSRIVSVAFKIQIASDTQFRAQDDAKSAKWFALDKLPPLAFDHDQVIQKSLNIKI